MTSILPQRLSQIATAGDAATIACSKPSLAGSVSQRACVFCGSRVVLYPIADALHLVHGPIGCAAYTWDIRGALSSGPQLHRLCFSTDLKELDVIHGGEKKLYAALAELIDRYRPKAAFVYSTCIVGLIGDDVNAVCKRLAHEKLIPVIPVDAPGFKGSKKDGYTAACQSLFRLLDSPYNPHNAWNLLPIENRKEGRAKIDNSLIPLSVNILGDFNIAGELWLIKSYFEKMGLHVVATMTGDGRVDDLRHAHRAALNLVQCSGSMTALAKLMEETFGTPFHRVSYFGIEDMAESLYTAARFFIDPAVLERTQALVRDELQSLLPQLAAYKKALTGKRAAIYVGGGFKALSLVKALRHLGMITAIVGTQTGSKDDYAQLQTICDPGTIIVDDTNPLELASFLREKSCDLLIGGVKERPLAYKLGVAFCDHNHERKIPLAGFTGMLALAKEVHASVLSPVWQFTRQRQNCLHRSMHLPQLDGGVA